MVMIIDMIVNHLTFVARVLRNERTSHNPAYWFASFYPLGGTATISELLSDDSEIDKTNISSYYITGISE